MHWAGKSSAKLNPKARYIKQNPSAIIFRVMNNFEMTNKMTSPMHLSKESQEEQVRREFTTSHCLSLPIFISLKMAPVEIESTWGKYGTFWNSFHPDVQQLKQRLEWITNGISRNEVSVLFNQTSLKEKMLYIYIYTQWFQILVSLQRNKWFHWFW